MKVQTAICVALEEVFVNVAHYAYGNGAGDMTLGIGFDEASRTVTFRMADKGTPFNPLEKPDPDITLSASKREIGGLGIFIAKKTMDSITYEYINGENVLIMTSYNAVNGYWAASNYDLTTTILREEWGFENFVMTDWWAKCNRTQNSYGGKDSLDAMVWSQNDLYMVCEDALVKLDSILKAIRDGTLTRAELLRCGKNILNWILKNWALIMTIRLI
jgi:anti-sigma regulatory factor (Ser/Thr protein kinase)